MSLIGFALLAALIQLVASPPGGSVSGEVRMRDGTPAVGVRVAALPAPREGVRAAEGQNYYATQQPTAVALTDGQGRYRLAMPPGRYIIAAGLAGSGTFYPSADDIDSATVLTLDSGATRTADIVLQTFPGARVAGRIVPPPAAGAREYANLAGVRLGEMLEAAVRADGSFEFGRIPPGEYLLNVVPTPPGHKSVPFRIEDRDVTTLEVVRSPTRQVSGRIVVDKGPLPVSLLSFSTLHGHAAATINPDLTFSVALHADQHRAALDGLPVGYDVRSVRVGSRDVTATGITVADRDVADVTIEVTVRRDLPTLRGRVTGVTVTAARTVVELTGPIVGKIEAVVSADGSFSVAGLPPGLYRATIAGRPEVPAVDVVVTSTGGEATLTGKP